MSDETPADMLNRMGDDAAKWAAEFRQTALKLGYSDMDEGWLIGWFANAIEHSYAIRRHAAEARAERAEAALRPFAAWCDEMESDGPVMRDEARVSSGITMGDVRRARAVLAQIEGTDDA